MITLFNWHQKSSIPDHKGILFVTTKKTSDEGNLKIKGKNSTCLKTTDDVVE